MKTTHTTVESRRDGYAPWYGVDVEDGEVVITEDGDGGRKSALQTARTKIPDHVDLPDESAVSQPGDVTYAITEDGRLIAYDPNADDVDVPPLRAHLGWFDAETDELTLVEFVDADEQYATSVSGRFDSFYLANITLAPAAGRAGDLDRTGPRGRGPKRTRRP